MYFPTKSLFSSSISQQKKQTFQSWEEFYENSEIQTFKKFRWLKEEDRKEITINSNYYIHRSVFYLLSSSTNGGGILITVESSDLKVLIEESYFYKCIATIAGGCIYKETNGHSVLNKICGISCQTQSSSSYSSPFCYINTGSTNLNYLFNSHINSCQNEIEGYTIYLLNGASFKDINMSRNNVKYWSCFELITTTDKEDHVVSFSTFESNTASERGCFFIVAKKLKMNIKNINCLYNSQKGTSEGLFLAHADTDMTIEDSSFIENESNGKYFFVNTGGSITLINCSISDDMTTNTQINTSKIGSESFTNNFDLIKERDCLFYVDKQKISCGTKKEKNINIFLSTIFLVQISTRKSYEKSK